MPVRLANRIRYRADDPLRYLRVPRRKRLTRDEGPRSTALNPDNDGDFDRDMVRNLPLDSRLK